MVKDIVKYFKVMVVTTVFLYKVKRFFNMVQLHGGIETRVELLWIQKVFNGMIESYEKDRDFLVTIEEWVMENTQSLLANPQQKWLIIGIGAILENTCEKYGLDLGELK